MTLQWSVVAFILYAEIAVVLLLLLPWIRPSIWKKIFNSRLIHSFKQFFYVYSYAIIVVLVLLFADAVREVKKYSHVELTSEPHLAANADAVIHMRLFRAQRNLYISGFALLLSLVINRLVTLLARTAQLEASAEAALKQATNAGKAAKNILDSSDGNEELKKMTSQLEDLQKKLKTAEADRDAMKLQSESLQKEYDRVCEQLNKQETGSTSGGGKKND